LVRAHLERAGDLRPARAVGVGVSADGGASALRRPARAEPAAGGELRGASPANACRGCKVEPDREVAQARGWRAPGRRSNPQDPRKAGQVPEGGRRPSQEQLTGLVLACAPHRAIIVAYYRESLPWTSVRSSRSRSWLTPRPTATSRHLA